MWPCVCLQNPCMCRKRSAVLKCMNSTWPIELTASLTKSWTSSRERWVSPMWSIGWWQDFSDSLCCIFINSVSMICNMYCDTYYDVIHVPAISWASYVVSFAKNLVKIDCVITPSHCTHIMTWQFDGLAQDCSNSIANAMELLLSYAKPSILCMFSLQGWMESSVLFYGYYFNKTFYFNSFIDSPTNYNMPLGYLLAIVAYFVCSLLAMVR